jgi:tetratricopeptide (TPR) repeat protein
MRKTLALGAVAVFTLAGCQEMKTTEERRTVDPINIIDEANLNDLMLTVGDPESSVSYFREAMNRDPERVDFKRGFAISLSRAHRYRDAATVFSQLEEASALSNDDRVEYAFVLTKLERWDDANRALSGVDSNYESARLYILKGMFHDQQSDWILADAAYGRALELSAQPAVALNNWGVSQMSRGDLPGAISTFEQVVYLAPSLFDAKNNLVIARGLAGDYRLPPISVSETEKALLLHNLALIALRRGDVDVAKGLLADAVEVHPLYYAQAAEKLRALETAGI